MSLQWSFVPIVQLVWTNDGSSDSSGGAGSSGVVVFTGESVVIVSGSSGVVVFTDESVVIVSGSSGVVVFTGSSGGAGSGSGVGSGSSGGAGSGSGVGSGSSGGAGSGSGVGAGSSGGVGSGGGQSIFCTIEALLPELSIHVCSHICSVGQLSEQNVSIAGCESILSVQLGVSPDITITGLIVSRQHVSLSVAAQGCCSHVISTGFSLKSP